MFLVPQISWGLKSSAIRAIAAELNISTDTIAFVDDDPFERDEVRSELPDVLAVDAAEIGSLTERSEFHPVRVTADASRRRQMVLAELDRRKDETAMAPGEFLASLEMRLTISRASEDDLDRLEELTMRTHQLNSTGYIYSRDELGSLARSPDHRLLVAELEDRYGNYGKVGVALVDLEADRRLLRLLLMSCRVMSRGVGRILLSHVLFEARAAGTPMRAEFVRTERNRPMYLTFKLAGFREIGRVGDVALLEHDLTAVDPYPSHVLVRTDC
jgi:FkbH-like protein